MVNKSPAGRTELIQRQNRAAQQDMEATEFVVWFWQWCEIQTKIKSDECRQFYSSASTLLRMQWKTFDLCVSYTALCELLNSIPNFAEKGKSGKHKAFFMGTTLLLGNSNEYFFVECRSCLAGFFTCISFILGLWCSILLGEMDGENSEKNPAGCRKVVPEIQYIAFFS